MLRNRYGEYCYPRIIERRPRLGDVHPLTKRVLTQQIRKLPVEAIYGLRSIELRSRQSSDIGQPFGLYRRKDKTIILYSLPSEWIISGFDIRLAKSLMKFHAKIDILNDDSGIRVAWPKPELMSFWFLCGVFVHELGHHFDNQYRHKNRQTVGRRFEELVAEQDARRYFSELLSFVRQKRLMKETRCAG